MLATERCASPGRLLHMRRSVRPRTASLDPLRPSPQLRASPFTLNLIWERAPTLTGSCRSCQERLREGMVLIGFGGCWCKHLKQICLFPALIAPDLHGRGFGRSSLAFGCAWLAFSGSIFWAWALGVLCYATHRAFVNMSSWRKTSLMGGGPSGRTFGIKINAPRQRARSISTLQPTDL